MGKLQINIDDQIKAPTVSNNSILLDSQSYTFKAADFTKDFNDPEGGEYSFVTLHKIPSITTLLYSGNPVQELAVIHADNMFDMSITLDDKYAIHNGHLYEFDKSIDQIITDYEATGYKLVYNNSGLLGFAKPSDITDIVVIEGTALSSSQLTFEFTTRAEPSGQESNKATLEIVPWENVNLKPNNIFAGDAPAGSDGKSAYEIAIDNGFVGTESDWLASLIGAQGPQGPIGPTGNDGADGTSVTILGSFTQESDLPASGNPGDSYLVNGSLYVWNGTIWENVGLIRGPKGDTGAAGTNGTDGVDGADGRSLEYIWDGTKLGIRYEGQTVYTYAELKGDKGNKGDKGDMGNQGISAYQVWLNLGNTGSQQDFINSLQGPKGDAGTNGLDGDDGLSAYQIWLALGNSGTTQDFINDITGPEGQRGPRGFTGEQGPAGEAATFTHNEIQYDWSTGQSQIFTVPNATSVTDVYIQGKRAEKANPDDSPDEWRVYSSTQIEILVPLDDGDRLTFVESAKFSLTDISDMLGYTPADDAELTALATTVSGKEDVSNKATNFGLQNDTLYPTVKAVADYIIAQGFLTGITEAQIEEALSYVIFKALGEQNLELDSPNTSSTIYFRENGAATFYSFIRYNATQNFFEFGSNDGSGEVISAVIDRGKTDWEFQNHIQILKAGRGVIFGSTTFNDTDIYSKGAGSGRYELRVQGSGVLELWSVDSTNALTTKVWDSESITVTKEDIGLGNVDNTSDIDKPVSTAQQTALDAKVDTLTFDGHAHGDIYYDKSEIDSAVSGINSNIANKIDKQSNITALWRGTQAEYDALTPDPNTIYFIEE